LQSDEDSVKLAGIRALTERGRHREALAAIAALAAPTAQSRGVLYLTAVNQRCLQQTDAALATLELLQQRFPHFGRLYEERGQCFAASNDLARAIAALEQGVALNAALPLSWDLLERLYRLAGNAEKAKLAAEHLISLRRLPPQIALAGSLFCDGELSEAERILRAYLSTFGNHVEALRLLGRIAHQSGALEDAEQLLRESVRMAPGYRAARADHARVLIDERKYSQAREELTGLLQLEADNRDYLALRATAWAGLGQHERAIASYRELLAISPWWTHLHLLLGNSLKAVGRQAEAIESYRVAQASEGYFSDACWSLANLKTYRFTNEELERMRLAEGASGTQFSDRCHLCFSLGSALEDRRDYAESWSFYERGNALKRSQNRYRPEFTEINTLAQIRVCTADLFAAHAGAGVAEPGPIFILGLPRSGSTLIEQILASHPKIEGTGELQEIERIARDLQGRERNPERPRYPGVLAEMQREDFRRLGERYLNRTRSHRTGRPYFIDKMPNNFQHIGLIHLMLPEAKIIDVRREPMACCFSNLKQLFASGQDFSYGVESVARYYRSYLELMRHWDAVLPGRVLRVLYEDVVEDLEAGVRRILGFCGLDFEPACLEFHKTARDVSTASSEQVRQPIFRAGLSQWRHYEPWLGGLKDALGDAQVRYRE
jgi:tetratricopeptide (TPR) repeat protein